jgi:hypothetical protein
MASLTDYFERKAYMPKYFLGDRVFGHWNKIPFVGKVGVDIIRSTTEGPVIAVILDLPLLYNGLYYTTIIVAHKDIKLLKNLDLEQEKSRSK